MSERWYSGYDGNTAYVRKSDPIKGEVLIDGIAEYDAKLLASTHNADIDRLEEDYRRSRGVRDELKRELKERDDLLRRLVGWRDDPDRGFHSLESIIADARALLEDAT